MATSTRVGRGGPGCRRYGGVCVLVLANVKGAETCDRYVNTVRKKVIPDIPGPHEANKVNRTPIGFQYATSRLNGA